LVSIGLSGPFRMRAFRLYSAQTGALLYEAGLSSGMSDGRKFRKHPALRRYKPPHLTGMFPGGTAAAYEASVTGAGARYPL